MSTGVPSKKNFKAVSVLRTSVTHVVPRKYFKALWIESLESEMLDFISLMKTAISISEFVVNPVSFPSEPTSYQRDKEYYVEPRLKVGPLYYYLNTANPINLYEALFQPIVNVPKFILLVGR
jgi:hypothetical protein